MISNILNGTRASDDKGKKDAFVDENKKLKVTIVIWRILKK